MAILAGDLMLTLAFRHLVESGYSDNNTACRLVSELATGTTCMVVGQVFDTLGGMPKDLTPEDQLRLVHRNKTGVLLRAACRMGAICGNANDAQLDALTRYGDAVGLMFQVVDDLLDVTQTAEHIGKATGKDELHGKLTYPGLLGVEASRKAVEHLHREAMGLWNRLARPQGPFEISDNTWLYARNRLNLSGQSGSSPPCGPARTPFRQDNGHGPHTTFRDQLAR